MPSVRFRALSCKVLSSVVSASSIFLNGVARLLFSRSFFESVSEIGRRRSRGAFARARVSNLAFFGRDRREDLCVE